MTAAADCSVDPGTTTRNKKSFSSSRHQSSPLLPKESEQAERKRPMAIQELLEKKRARLAHNGVGGTAATNGLGEAEGKEDGEEEEEGKAKQGESELAELVGHLCSREHDSETTSSSSSSGGGNFGNPVEHSLGQLLKRAMANSERILADPKLLLALQETQAAILAKKEPIDEEAEGEGEEEADDHKQPQGKLKSPNKSALASSPAKSGNNGEIGESPLSKSVPHDRIFAQVPGRLSLLSNVVKYKMTVGEVKRRLIGPESFNFSLLGALLRRAKMPEKSQMLVDELSQVGLSIPRGRRRLSQVTLLSALTEAESTQFAKDFKKIAESEFPAQQMAIELLPSTADPMTVTSAAVNDSLLIQTRLDKLLAALKMTTEFVELLEKDQSPVMENNAEPILSEELQNSLSNFSMLTHGFGNPAIQVGVGCFVSFLKKQIRICEERLEECRK